MTSSSYHAAVIGKSNSGPRIGIRRGNYECYQILGKRISMILISSERNRALSAPAHEKSQGKDMRWITFLPLYVHCIAYSQVPFSGEQFLG